MNLKYKHPVLYRSLVSVSLRSSVDLVAASRAWGPEFEPFIHFFVLDVWGNNVHRAFSHFQQKCFALYLLYKYKLELNL